MQKRERRRAATVGAARHWDLAGDAVRAAECYVAAAEASAQISEAPTTLAHV